VNQQSLSFKFQIPSIVDRENGPRGAPEFNPRLTSSRFYSAISQDQAASVSDSVRKIIESNRKNAKKMTTVSSGDDGLGIIP
jgi:hypothetical protein